MRNLVKQMSRVPTVSYRAKNHKHIRSLLCIYYVFSTDDEKNNVTLARMELSEVNTNRPIVSREFNGHALFELAEEGEPFSNVLFRVLPASPKVRAKSLVYLVPSIIWTDSPYPELALKTYPIRRCY